MIFEPNLFSEPALPGLTYRDDFLSEAEAAELVARINSVELTPFQFQQWTGKRLTRSFGWSYDFTSGRLEPTRPMPGWLLPIRDRAAAFAGLKPDELVQALLICYDPGAGIGWHRDRPAFEQVIGISLGEPAAMRFRRRAGNKFERRSVPLGTRSIYHLTGEVRHNWEHSIAEMQASRWSITFRSLARGKGG
jgi:alkylated DNA repair dioxygenase AlkB